MFRMAALSAVVVMVGCGVTESQVVGDDAPQGEGSAELGTASRTYVTVRHDMRKCISPLCGGYWVADVNRATLREVYVNGLDFSGSNLSQESIDAALQGDAVVFHGKLGPAEPRFGTRPFLVSAAWRGMPGITRATGESFFRVAESRIECFTTPCPQLLATRLNAGGSTRVGDVAVSRASLMAVDQTWLANRIVEHGALVAAKLTPSQTDGQVLDASQVYVKLPEQPGPCPLVKMPGCQGGKVYNETRTEDRCVLPSMCVTPGPCTFFLPMCPDGYTRVQWKGRANACPVVACDPTFTVPAAQ